jgi:hypothetical protein
MYQRYIESGRVSSALQALAAQSRFIWASI